jgi:hypothetical protein
METAQPEQEQGQGEGQINQWGGEINVNKNWMREQDIPSSLTNQEMNLMVQSFEPAVKPRRRQALPKLQLKDSDCSFLLDGSAAASDASSKGGMDHTSLINWAKLDQALEQPNALGLTHAMYVQRLRDSRADATEQEMLPPKEALSGHGPAGRMDAIMLLRLLEAALKSHRAELLDRSQIGEYTRDSFYSKLKREWQLYDTVFEEAARQVLLLWMHISCVQPTCRSGIIARSVDTSLSVCGGESESYTNFNLNGKQPGERT